jgi:hypothetical protein
MNIYKNLLLFSAISFITGMIFFGIYKEYIIVRYTQNTLQAQPAEQQAAKKTVTLTFWNSHQWKTETDEILWHSSKAENLRTLVTRWLQLIAEEQILDKKITVQAALLAPSDYDAFISFDMSPLPDNGPIINKLRFIEGLLKTVRENDIPLQTIHFLVNHQPIVDPHLDFINPWPIGGFLKVQ